MTDQIVDLTDVEEDAVAGGAGNAAIDFLVTPGMGAGGGGGAGSGVVTPPPAPSPGGGVTAVRG